MKLHEQIRIAREKRGLSVQQLAEELGVSRTSVIWWEEGKHAPRLPMLARMEELLKIKFNATQTTAPEGVAVGLGGLTQEDLQLALAILRLPAPIRLAITTLVSAYDPAPPAQHGSGEPFFEIEGRPWPDTATAEHAAKPPTRSRKRR